MICYYSDKCCSLIGELALALESGTSGRLHVCLLSLLPIPHVHNP